MAQRVSIVALGSQKRAHAVLPLSILVTASWMTQWRAKSEHRLTSQDHKGHLSGKKRNNWNLNWRLGIQNKPHYKDCFTVFLGGAFCPQTGAGPNLTAHLGWNLGKHPTFQITRMNEVRLWPLRAQICSLYEQKLNVLFYQNFPQHSGE